MTDRPERQLFDASPTPMVLVTREGAVAHLNHAARKMLAVKAERIVGRPILGTVVPDDRARVREFFRRVLNGQRREWIARFRRGDAAVRVQWVRAVPWEDGVLMFTRDLTESREGRPEMLQFQTVFENLPGQFATVLDPLGRIRYSSSLSRTHFVSDVDAIGTPFLDLLEPGEESERQVADMLEHVLAGDHWASTTWHRRVEGTVFPVRTCASPYLNPRDGRVLGVLLVGRDTSPEHGLRERTERDRRSAAVGDLVVRVAAELEARLGRAEDAVRGPSTADAALASVRGFLAALAMFAEPTSEKRQWIPLDSVVREAVATARSASPAVDILLAEPEGPVEVMGERRLLTRMADALLENAVEAVGARGGPVRVRVFSGPAGAMFTVSNAGAADDEQALHRAFEPFFTTKPGSVGLGLPIARAVVQAHGGRIWTDAESDGVVTFAVQLPIDSDAVGHRYRPVPLVLSRTRTVLLVDDEEAVRLGLRKFLERVGFEVREAWSGRSAFAQITAGRPPEIVLTDLRMSDGSGEWFLDQLSRDFPELLRRTVIMTGVTVDEEVLELVRRTGCPLLTKPLEMPDLLELLDEVEQRR